MEPTIKGLGWGDVHWTTEPPVCRTDRYLEELSGYFEQIKELADLAKPDFLFCCADWFHRKGRASHADTRSLMEALGPLVDAHGPILSTIGNHDMVGNNADHALVDQPIGVLQAAGYIRVLDIVRGEFHEIEVGGQKFRITGLPYCETNRLPAKMAGVWKIKTERMPRIPLVLLCHHDAKAGWNDWLHMIGGPQVTQTPTVILNGHLHDKRDECRFTKANVGVYNLGSLARTSIAEKDLQIEAALVELSAKRYSVKRLPLASLPTTTNTFIEPTAASGDEKETNVDLDNFLASLKSEDDKPRDFEKLLKERFSTTVDPAALSLATTYIREAAR